MATVGAWFLIPPRNYLPSGNQNLMFAFVITPPGYSMDEYRRMGERIESVVRPWWEVGPEAGERIGPTIDDGDGVPVAREDTGQRGADASATDDDDVHGGGV